MELVPDRVASMMSCLGNESFGGAILELMDPDYEITHCAGFERALTQQVPRVVVAAQISPQENELSRELAKQWMADDYRIDPWLADVEAHARDVPSVHFVDIAAAPRCTGARARMVERYYDPLGLGEEATYIVREPSRVVSISLYKRRGSGPFTVAQRTHLGGLASLMVKSTQRHAELLGEAAVKRTDVPLPAPAELPADWTQSRAEKFTRLRSALLIDKGHLTLREAEICAYIVLGYTVLGISLLLNISTNTVATHRKRAYAKLGLSSQTELFNVCLRHCV